MKKYALISVTDKTGVVEFSRGLLDLGFSILSTGGTAKVLKENGISYTPVSEFTGQKEILGGRVKTLHPKVHAGILSRRDNESDILEMKEGDFSYIDVVAVNLYPFIQVLNEKGSSLSLKEMIEYIDIGGPCMLRASAKNFHSVYSVIDPNDYNEVLSCLKINQESEEVLTFKRKLSAKVFAHTAAYDLAIAEYISAEYLSTEHLANNVPSKSEAGDASSNQAMPRYTGFVLKQAQSLRYGENPHQSASSYVPLSASVSPDSGLSFVSQLQGKELSYNNLNDFSATISLGLDLFNQNRNKYQSVIVKHANPCGVSYGSNLLESFEGALSCDPVSAFGGVIFFSHELDLQTATLVSEAFYEIIIAPKVSSDAKVILSKKKNLRVLEVDYELATSELKKGSSFKSILGSFLVQTKDSLITRMNDVDWVSGSGFQGTEKEDAELSWTTVKHVTSNAITIASGGKIIGVGAGQMNRLDSSKIAVERAKRFGFSTKGSVVSSDAFFPFPDSIEVFRDAEVGLIIQPGGSVRDQEVFDAAKEFGIKMICTGRRHFKH